MSVFEWPVRIYYEDTDAGGVVYYANYLRYLERARTEWLRSLGFNQQALKEEAGILFAVRHVEIDYLASACLDDELTVEASIGKIGGASLLFDQRILRGVDEVLCMATVKVVCIDSNRSRPTALPRTIREKIRNA